MSSGIIDTSILVDCLRGRSEAIAFLSALAVLEVPATHVIVAAELLAGARDKRDQTLIDSFLSKFELLLPNESDSQRALGLYRQHHLSHGVDWPDCQIGATALRLNLAVYTINVKHFNAFGGLRVLSGY